MLEFVTLSDLGGQRSHFEEREEQCHENGLQEGEGEKVVESMEGKAMAVGKVEDWCGGCFGGGGVSDSCFRISCPVSVDNAEFHFLELIWRWLVVMSRETGLNSQGNPLALSHEWQLCLLAGSELSYLHHYTL